MMKYLKISFYALFLLGILGIVSCEDYLDKSPESDIDPTEPFENFRNFQGFTEELYACIPVYTAYSWHNSFNLGEEVYWDQSATTALANMIDRGNYWGWSGEFYSGFKKTDDVVNKVKSTNNQDKGYLWSFCWYGIRKTNIGIENLDLLTDATQEEKDLIAGQLYFFRGWFHLELMKYWGGLPYIDQVLPSDVPIRIPRLTYQETADKVSEDLRKAAELLPVDWDDTEAGTFTKGNNMQRANKIMALAYLGKNLLFAGSPLMNEASGGSATYNEQYCQEAADVLGQALSLSESTGRYGLVPFSEYSNLFYTQNSRGKIPGFSSNGNIQETIFWENATNAATRFRWNQINDYISKDLSQGGYYISPTANYAFDNYGMANGLPINESRDVTLSDAESGYSSEYPWKDRDPRFYNDYVIDGERCSASESLDEGIQFASLYSEGHARNIPSNPGRSNLTGLALTKWRPRLAEKNTESLTMTNNCVVLSLMRLADVYLMYAEATAVGYGVNQSAGTYSKTAVDAINVIRDRAGVGRVASKFTSSLDGFMSEVRRERAVELAFEGHRFADLRRWKLLDKSPYNLKCSLEFERDPEGLTGAALAENYKDAKVLNLSMNVIFERQFTAKHYWFPFVNEDVTIYKEFGQNPGW
ncbi:RagB/SusD family nutrient uptake outer membrane protein [Plebeiibacterium sediminum]|uniref:RagB/SusD family nutrient uptake outer membrane protein n=1 Tax=Plebeiibacterium sediminum TaxID=2992112 RepID=A0AAE3SDV5_9BACT|nr:RagB/SusD family nutrient uptake outer membrane protein [Plebeiobacterium sediminum]MCW3785833.1 RagB/SusD family nutrient uptake outer membrane protein [Plebeiobacterium sediminum]